MHLKANPRAAYAPTRRMTSTSDRLGHAIGFPHSLLLQHPQSGADDRLEMPRQSRHLLRDKEVQGTSHSESMSGAHRRNSIRASTTRIRTRMDQKILTCAAP